MTAETKNHCVLSYFEKSLVLSLSFPSMDQNMAYPAYLLQNCVQNAQGHTKKRNTKEEKLRGMKGRQTKEREGRAREGWAQR